MGGDKLSAITTSTSSVNMVAFLYEFYQLQNNSTGRDHHEALGMPEYLWRCYQLLLPPHNNNEQGLCD